MRNELQPIINLITIKRTDRTNAEKKLKELQVELKECTAKEDEAKKANKSGSKYFASNYVHSNMLNKHRIKKSYYHRRDLEGYSIRRSMSAGIIVFDEISRHVIANKPDSVRNEEIRTTCLNHSRLCSLMDSIFSAMYSKRGSMTISKVNALKTDLNLLRIKWNKMNLSYTLKFHVLHEHLADLLLEMDSFYDVDEDAIER